MKLQRLAAERDLLATAADSAASLAMELALRVAAALREAIALRGVARLALSGGRSPEAFLRCLNDQPIEWERVAITLVDERWVPPDDEASNEGMLRRCLPWGCARARFLPLYRGSSPEEDAQAAGRELAPWLPLDVLVLGMGADGHCASLFADQAQPDGLLRSDAGAPCAAVRAPDGSPRITLTAKVLRSSRLQLLAISGDDKYRTLCEAFTATSEQMPVAAFLAPPLHIFYSHDG